MEQNQNMAPENLSIQPKKSNRLTDFISGFIGSIGIYYIYSSLTDYLLLTSPKIKLVGESSFVIPLIILWLPSILYVIGIIFFSVRKRWFVVLGISISPILFIIDLLYMFLPIFKSILSP